MSTNKASCPICGKPVEREWRPFCSERCQQVDLHRWLSEGYSIPGAEDESASAEDERDER